MKYLHTMVRVSDLEASLDFYCNQLGLQELRRVDVEAGRFTLVFLAAPGDEDAQIELTYNWDPEKLAGGRNFGHVAYHVPDIYETCLAFVRSPDQISIELLQEGPPLPPQEPWASMPNVGEW
jgi:lactoylglutathione lyase